MSQIASSASRLLVRCDVGPAYGVGHLMRCVALAEEFAARGHEVVFSAAVEDVPFALEQVRRRGFRWVDPPDSVDGLVEQARAADAVVIDSYVLPREAYSAVRRVRPTLAIVDGDPSGKDGHVLVDQNIGAEEDDWPLPEGAVRLAGLDYALMRDEIRDARTARHDPATGAVRVFAFFGGTDAFGAAPVRDPRPGRDRRGLRPPGGRRHRRAARGAVRRSPRRPGSRSPSSSRRTRSRPR